jgi:hypothetical protein
MIVNAQMGRRALYRSRRFLVLPTTKTGGAEIAGKLTIIVIICDEI